MARRQGGRPGFLGLSRGGRQPAVAAAGATVPQCRRPPGAAPSPPPRHPDRPTDGARAAARGDAGNGDPLRNDTAAVVALAGKADNVGQENDDCGGDNRDDDKNNDKWGRGA
jgi:hypothetical protein